MIEFKKTMDNHSRQIWRDGKYIGNLIWHQGCEPRIILNEELSYLTISETKQVLGAYEEILKKRYYYMSNWNGDLCSFSSVEEAEESARKREMGAVSVYDNFTGEFVKQVDGGAYYA